MKNILIQSQLIRLRPTTQADLDFVVQSETSDDNRAFVGQWSHQKHLVALADPNIVHLIIEAIDDNQPVGYIIVTELTDPKS